MHHFLIPVLNWFAGKFLLLTLLCLGCFFVIAVPRIINGYLGTAEKRAAHWESVKNAAETKASELQKKKEGLEDEVAKQKQMVAKSQKQLDDLNKILSKVTGILNPKERQRRKKEAQKRIVSQKKMQAGVRAELTATKKEEAETLLAIEEARSEQTHAVLVLNERTATIQDINILVKPWVKAAIKLGVCLTLAYILTPWIYGLLGYYLFAPLISRGKPVLLSEGTPKKNSATGSSQSLVVTLAPNQEMVAKEEYLQSNQEELRKSTCWIWKWRYPVTSLLCGLTMLTRVRNVSKNENSSQRITFSHQDNGLLEVAKIRIPREGALVIRPSFIAGLIYDRDKEPDIKTKWVFKRLHAWVTFQFRYFIIKGPVEVLVAAGRGVKSERLNEDYPRLRINRKLTVAFSPTVGYNSIRAETLMAYLRKKNPLFDDHFSGDGVVYNQQTHTGTDGGDTEKAWGRLASGIGKVLGF